MCLTATFVVAVSAWARLPFDHIEVPLTPAMRQYCHIVRFPQGWAMQRLDDEGDPLSFRYGSEYEFRVEGVLSTRFLVGGFQTWVRRRYDTTNRYKVDLSDSTAPVLSASREAWESAAVVPLIRKSAFPPSGRVPSEKLAELHGFQFGKSGDIWCQPSDCASRLSPDQAWLVLQSRSRANADGHTKVSFDIFNADTGSKVITIVGIHEGRGDDPDGALSRTAWVTERYFIVPLGEHKERCLVCEFGGQNRHKE
jgi:hypothetical protein